MAQNLPDSEILMRTWLLNQSEVTSDVGTNVATRLPSNGSMPFVVCVLKSSVPVNQDGGALIYEANFDIDCYAGQWGANNTKGNPDYGLAFQIANNVARVAFDSTPKRYTSSGGVSGVIMGFNPISGPFRVEESELGLARYTTELAMIYGASS